MKKPVGETVVTGFLLTSCIFPEDYHSHFIAQKQPCQKASEVLLWKSEGLCLGVTRLPYLAL